MHVRRTQLFFIVLVLGLCPLFPAAAQNYTYNLAGTLGPNLNGGPDCLEGNGSSETASVTVSSTANPVKTTATSATYVIPPGDITATISSIGAPFTNTTNWYMVVFVTSKYDALAFAGTGPLGSKVTAFGALPVNTFDANALKHPENITKTIQQKSPSSWLNYSVPALSCTATKLGFTGTIN
jgi:hypothetical protein